MLKSESSPRNKMVKGVAGIMAGLALTSVGPLQAEALPSPLPVQTSASERYYRDQQTIQRQMALGIAEFLTQNTDDERHSKEVKTIEVSFEGDDSTAMDIDRGFLNGRRDAKGRMALADLRTYSSQDPPQVIFWAERDTAAGDRRVIISATMNPELTAAVNAAATERRAPDPDILIDIASDPATVFDTEMMKGPHDRDFEDQIGGDAGPIDSFSIDTLQKTTTEYASFLSMSGS